MGTMSPRSPDFAAVRQQALLRLTSADRAEALHNVLWGYEDDKLSLDELRSIVLGQMGAELAHRFVDNLRRGVFSQRGNLMSFAAVCVKFDRYDALEMMATLPSPVLVCGLPYGPSEWLDMLCTRVVDSKTIKFTLYETATQRSAESASKLLELAYRHQPDHPHVDMLIERGGPIGALMAGMVMEKRMRAGEARLAEQTGDESAAPTRRQRSTLSI